MYLVEVCVSEVLDNKNIETGYEFKTQRRIISIDLGEFETQKIAEEYMRHVQFRSPATDKYHERDKA